MTDGNRRAIVAAFLANLGIAIAKLVAWIFTGAASMLAEGVHSLADTANQGLLFLGGARARRAADAEHPFGYGRERYFWAFVVAVVLFLMGGLFAVSEGISKLQHPHELSSPAWAIGVLAVALVLEGLSFRTALVEANKVREAAGWWAFVRHAKSPELPVVLLEDAGAQLGLVMALVGVCLAALTGNPMWDAMGSIGIGALLILISIVLCIEMKSLIIGESASESDERAILEALSSAPHVERVLHVRTLHVGPDQLFLGAKVELARGLGVQGVADAINAAEDAVRAAVPIVDISYIEPDIHDPDHPDDRARSGSAERMRG
jgi:cation diffusion facilitator family transporter